MNENSNQSKQVFRQDIQTSARYAQLLKIAEKACKQFKALSIGYRLNRFNHELDLNEDELLIVGHDYIVSSMEAFINHLGFILHCSWENFERRNFWDQYKELIQLLELTGIDTDAFKKTPYASFESIRSEVRNRIHHVHSSKHDVSFECLEHTLDEDNQHDPEMKSNWIDVKIKELEQAILETKKFIEDIRQKVEATFYDVDHFDAILCKKICEARHLERSRLLERFLDDPFCGIELLMSMGWAVEAEKN